MTTRQFSVVTALYDAISSVDAQERFGDELTFQLGVDSIDMEVDFFNGAITYRFGTTETGWVEFDLTISPLRNIAPPADLEERVVLSSTEGNKG